MALAAKNGAPDPFSNDASRTITIELVPTPERIEARIQARNDQGSIVSEQIAHAPTFRCDQLADRIVFLLHDIIDPIALPEPEIPPIASNPISSNRQLSSEKRTAPPETPTSIAEKPIVTDQQPPKPPKTLVSKPRMALSLSLGATWWNAPHAAFTSVLGIGGRWPKFSFGIEGRYDQAWRLPSVKSALAEQLAVGIVGCGYHVFSPSRLYFRGCLLGDVTRLSTTERIRLRELRSITSHIGARAGAGLSLARMWSIELYADGIIVVEQPRFLFNVQENWQLPRFNGALRASVVALLDVF